jgi:adenine-specific DNA methylase
MLQECGGSEIQPLLSLTDKNTNVKSTVEVAANKVRGGYYTPAEIAAWLCRWAIRSANDRVLEPSSGDGVFLAAAGARLLELGAKPKDALDQISGVEIEQREATKAADRLEQMLGIDPNGQVVCTDFFAWLKVSSDQKYDCAVGNPPFIRYQNFPEPSRSRAMALMAQFGLRPNKLTNTWVPFLVGAIARLVEGGRLAFVLPAELLQVSYAGQLRRFLANHFARIQIYACNRLVFDLAEQEVVLMLAEGYSRAPLQCEIELIETSCMSEVLAAQPNQCDFKGCSIVDHSTEKWLKYFLSPVEIGLMRALRSQSEVARLGHHAEIDIGIVTGRNEFFVVSKKEIEGFALAEYVVPLVGRSSQLRGASLNEGEWQSFADEGQRVYLLLLNGSNKIRLKAGVKWYVQKGEERGFHLGYKCSIRDPWYTLPSVWVPDSFFFRQIYDFPRAVLNCANAVSTDTIHRMRFKRNSTAVVPNLYTHLTAASAEIEGRSYGGGVLELEPNEAEHLLVPKTLRRGLPLSEIDRLVRAGMLEDVLRENDRLILAELGISRSECKMLRRIWQKMRERRRSRKKLS